MPPFAMRMRVITPPRAATTGDNPPMPSDNITDTYLIPMDEWELIFPPDEQQQSFKKRNAPPNRLCRWRWRRAPGMMIKFELDESVPDDIIE